MVSMLQTVFLHALLALRAHAADSFLSKQIDLNLTLLEALEASLGHDSLSSRANRLEGILKPMFMSLPQNQRGLLSHGAARYALHRSIGELHGWSIAGLEPNATTFNTTSLIGSGILRGVVPVYIEETFEAYVGSDGFSLRDLTILASTIEHLVHEDQRSILRRICELFDLPTVGALQPDVMRSMILMYKAVFLIGAGASAYDLAAFTAADATKLLQRAPRLYPGWNDTVMFVDDEIETLAFHEQSWSNPFRNRENSLQVAFRVVERAADHFARNLADTECQEIREDLLAYEIADTGRIRLADFYRASMSARFFYTETKDFLQAVGAIDNSDAARGPKVIVSNYVLSKSNCLAHSNTYSICCLNECEALYRHLEDATVDADRSPARIAALVARMSSSTVQAPRNLSQSLLRRLEEITLSSRGEVLLHNRLFGQWMHQAFPRECPYPHLVGTTTSMSPTAWGQHHGVAYRIDKGAATRMTILNSTIERLEKEFASRDVEHDVSGDDALMWTTDEESFVAPSRSPLERVIAVASAIASRGGLLIVPAVGVVALFIKTSAVGGSRKPMAADVTFV